MAKTKRKLKEETKASGKVNAKKKEGPRLSCMIWEKEIAALQSTTFETIEEATKEIIRRVVDRLGGDEESKRKVEEFLFEVIDTDPGLKDELRKVLRIG